VLIYVQGSIALGTAVKPIGRLEFDVDLIARLTDLARSYSQTLVSGVAELQLARPLAAGRHTLVIDYDAPFRSNAEGLYHVKVGDEWYVWTQMEPLDARRMFPSFDEPRHKTPYTISVTAPAGEKV
jgi:aminopeptidase N